MKRNKIWFCLLIICNIFSLIYLTKSSSSSSSSVSFLGIPPQDEDYFKADIIKCKNGSKKFARAQLNDNFCDCPDGTDEPGTSACPQGKFYCHNVGHLPISLPSSRVNDGICDCCDGSDEYDGNVKCPNTCWEAGKVARDKLHKMIDMYKEGIVLRRKEIEQAKQAIISDKEELSKLKDEEKTLKRLVKQLEVQKEQIEKAEEKERLEKEKEEEEKKLTEEREEAGDKSEDGKKENSSSEREKDEYATMAEESWQDEPESTEELSKEELGRLVASRWTGEKTGDQPEKVDAENSHGGNTETTESTNDKVDNNRNDKKPTTGNGLTTSWFKKIKDALQNILELVNVSPPPVDKLDADRVRKEYDDASTRLIDVESRISSLMEKLKHDFGREKEFYRLYDQCFETKQDKYVYKVCPFKEATQEEGYSRTQLGDWDKFENSHRIMVFSNGQGCWNGPNRSLKVKLGCGLKTELADVDEPSRCEYSALMTTPILCLEEKLEEFKHKLEDMLKEQPAAHDEL